MTINEQFWLDYKISENDLDLLYNHLLETQFPANKKELSIYLIEKIVEKEKDKQTKERLSGAKIYQPNGSFSVGETLVFPKRNWQKGKITSKRKGNNPDYSNLEIITVEFSGTEQINFASNIEDHELNRQNPLEDDTESLAEVITKFESQFSTTLEEVLNNNTDLVCIAGSYFPRSLLVDVSIGHLNLCEAVLEMNSGGPLTTHELVSQIELPTDVNANLTEFSLNLALQEDSRFDEVGPAGVTLWFLNRLEPEEVRSSPPTLCNSIDKVDLPVELQQYISLGAEVCDELEDETCKEDIEEVTLCLTFPHWRAGTLPLTPKLRRLFPTAYETPRVKFDFIDGNSSVVFPGWVVRPSKYIFGLSEWYQKEGFIPGSLIHVSKSNNPGQVIVRADKQKNMKDWIRTVLVGADGGIVFALLKQVATSTFDERMALVIPDIAAVDKLWDSKSRQPIEKTILLMARELVKLNPQGHFHAQEIYSAVNLIRRCPPSVIIKVLFGESWSTHLGDLYFRIMEN